MRQWRRINRRLRDCQSINLWPAIASACFAVALTAMVEAAREFQSGTLGWYSVVSASAMTGALMAGCGALQSYGHRRDNLRAILDELNEIELQFHNEP